MDCMINLVLLLSDKDKNKIKKGKKQPYYWVVMTKTTLLMGGISL